MAPMLTRIAFTPATRTRTIRTVGRAGLRVRLALSERATLRVELRRGTRRLATRTVRTTRAGEKSVLLRLSRTARARLGRRTTTLTVRLRATDRVGNTRTVTRRLRVRGP